MSLDNVDDLMNMNVYYDHFLLCSMVNKFNRVKKEESWKLFFYNQGLWPPPSPPNEMDGKETRNVYKSAAGQSIV